MYFTIPVITLLPLVFTNELSVTPFGNTLKLLDELERKSSCFRDAARSLELDCSAFEGADDTNLRVIYAVRLTMCELQASRVEVPTACDMSHLETYEDTLACLDGLQTRGQWWTTYSGYFKAVAEMCHVSRQEVEKDVLLEFHRNLTLTQVQLVETLYEQLDEVRHLLAEREAMSSMFDTFKKNLFTSFENVLSTLNETNDQAVSSVSTTVSGVVHIFEDFVVSLRSESSAQIASALELTTGMSSAIQDMRGMQEAMVRPNRQT